MHGIMPPNHLAVKRNGLGCEKGWCVLVVNWRKIAIALSDKPSKTWDGLVRAQLSLCLPRRVSHLKCFDGPVRNCFAIEE